jgi:hypothetical protein
MKDALWAVGESHKVSLCAAAPSRLGVQCTPVSRETMHLLDGDAGPLGHDVGDVLVVDDGTSVALRLLLNASFQVIT